MTKGVAQIAAGLAPIDGQLCQLGTHCKGARMGNASVASFRTNLTGGLLALLGRHSLLADFLAGAVTDGPAFQADVAAAANARLVRRPRERINRRATAS